MRGTDATEVTRRSVLRGAAGGAAAALSLSTAGAAGAATTGTPTGTATESPDIDEWLSDTSNYDGTIVDETGKDEVTIEVGVSGNGGNYAFGPPAVRIDPGTTVVWEWTGEGQSHNVHAMEGAGFQSETTAQEGFTYSRTLDSEGVITYQCDPHFMLGMKGVLVVGDIQLGGAVKPDFGGWLDGVDGGYRDARDQDEVTVEVGAQGNGGNLAFSPAGLWIDPGTTVVWEWTGQGGGHNVHAQDGADFESELQNSEGATYSRTLDAGGIITYQCDPHVTAGMKGAIAVGDDVLTVPVEEGGDGGDDGDDAAGDGGFTLPGGDPGVALVVATLGITGIAALAVLAREYRGAFGGESGEATWPAADEGIEREIDHEEFDPTGTATLIAIYFLILVGLWVFMYFVEFLGNGPTVIG